MYTFCKKTSFLPTIQSADIEQGDIVDPDYTEYGAQLDDILPTKKKIVYDTWLIMAILAQLIGGAGQAIFLPIFISTLTRPSGTGEYFVFFIESSLFNLPFGIACIYEWRKGNLTIDMMKKYIPIFILMGLCDGLHELLVVYTSALGRTSGDLQSILIQATIPFTILFSRYIVKIKLSRQESIGAFVVMVGILFSTIPSLIDLAKGETAAKLWFYPLIFFLSAVPWVLINVLQHKVFVAEKQLNQKYCKSWMLFVEGLVQFLFTGSMFWVDFTLPYIKTSNNIHEFSSNFNFGFQCFFNPSSAGGRCAYSWVFGLLFAGCYCMDSWSGSYTIEHASANFLSLITSISTPIQISIWFGWEWLTIWAGGDTYTLTEVIFGLIVVFIFVLPGAFIYRKYECIRHEQEKKKNKEENIRILHEKSGCYNYESMDSQLAL